MWQGGSDAWRCLLIAPNRLVGRECGGAFVKANVSRNGTNRHKVPRAVQFVDANIQIHAESFSQNAVGHHFFDGPLSTDAALRQDHHAVGVLGDLTQVMHHRQAREVALFDFGSDQGMQLDLVPDIKVRRGFVEHQHVGLLGEGALAMATRFCSPPDRSVTGLSANSARPVCSNTSSTIRRSVFEGTSMEPWCGARPMATTWRTVKPKATLTCWGTTAMRRAISRRLKEGRGFPKRETEPALGEIKPVRTRTRVVFPAPFGPMRATSSPASTRVETSDKQSLSAFPYFTRDTNKLEGRRFVTRHVVTGPVLTLRGKCEDDAWSPSLAEEGAYVDNTGDKQEVRRVIKRYSNRKLYDTRDSRYVTLLQIAEMVRRGEDVQIIDNTTKEDKTEVTLALAISEELKAKPRSVPLGTLRNLIQERSEKILTSLRDGPIGRLIPEGESEGVQEASEPTSQPVAEQEIDTKDGSKPKVERKPLAELVATSRHTLDQWQHAIDDRIRAVLPNFSLFLDIQAELRRLKQRVEALEKRLGQEPPPESEAVGTEAVEKELPSEPGDGSKQPAQPASEQASQQPAEPQAGQVDEDPHPEE